MVSVNAHIRRAMELIDWLFSAFFIYVVAILIAEAVTPRRSEPRGGSRSICGPVRCSCHPEHRKNVARGEERRFASRTPCCADPEVRTAFGSLASRSPGWRTCVGRVRVGIAHVAMTRLAHRPRALYLNHAPPTPPPRPPAGAPGLGLRAGARSRKYASRSCVHRATPSISDTRASVGTIFVSSSPAARYSERNSCSERWRPPATTSMLTSFAAAPRLSSEVSMRSG